MYYFISSGSRRRAARVKDTPESSPERSQKAKMAAKIRDDARKKMLAEKRAAMKQQRQQEADNVEIYVADKSDSPGPNSGSEGAEAWQAIWCILFIAIEYVADFIIHILME